MGLRIGIVIGLAACCLSAQAPGWTYGGPQQMTSSALQGAPVGGPLAALAPGAPGVMYAGGLGGVWEYSGGAWLPQPLTAGQPVSTLTIGASGVLYAGTGDVNDGGAGRGGVGVLESGDAGATWTVLGAGTLAGLAITRIAVDPHADNHLLASTVAEPDSPAGVQPGLYASSDSGATWIRVVPGAVWDFAWDGAGGEVLAAGGAGLELSLDNGASFTPVAASGLPTAWGRAVVCVRPGGGFLALFADTTGVTASLAALSEDGATATALTPPPNLFSNGILAIALATDGSAPDHFWVGGQDLWETGDGAQNWSDLTNSSQPDTTVHGQQHAIVSAADGSLWLANDGGLWMADNGAVLENLNAGLGNAAPLALAINGGEILAALAGGGTASAGTQTWTIEDGGQSFDALAAGNTPGVYFAADGAGSLFTSSDSGVSWAQQPGTGVSGTITALAAGGWMGTSTGQILEAGMSCITPTGGQAVTAIAMAGAATGSSPIWVASAGDVWAGSGCAGWAPAPFSGASALAANNQAVAVASGTGVWVSWDSGSHWSAVGGGLPAAPVTGLAFDGSGNLWAATLGRGVWSIPASALAPTIQLTANPTSAPVGASVQLQAAVTQMGAPVADATVTFSASQNQGAAWSASTATDTDGSASISYTLPNTAGAVELSAAVGTAGGAASASIAVNATAGAPAQIVVVSGANQSQTAGAPLAEPVVLEVVDAEGNSVPGVALALSAGAGNFTAASITTGSNGQASAAYITAATAGAATLTATAGALSVSWTETALSAPDYQITLTAPAAAAPNSVATLVAQVVPIGAYTASVTLTCVTPPAGCSITPSTVAPNGTATVSVNTGALDANEPSAVVEIEGDATHTASATLPLEGFTLTASSTTLTTAAGAAAATMPMTVAGVNGFTGSVAFTATLSDGSALPSNLTAEFTPATPALDANTPSITVQFGVAASAADTTAAWRRVDRGGGRAGRTGFLWLLAALLLALPRRRAWVVAALALAAAGCGGGASPALAPLDPTVSSYSLVITASAGGMQASAPVTLTVITPAS